MKKLQADPYLPLGEVTGYSFKQADHLGIGFGIALDSLERADGSILAVLLQALTMEGETYLELEELLPAAKELTNINFDRLAEAVNDLQDKKKVVVEKGRASLLAPFQVESEIVTDLEDLLAKGKEADYREKDLDQAIKRAERKLGISYDPEQKQAIKNAVTSPVSILTGGPGSGKTTIIDGILLVLKDLVDMDEEEAEEAILLAAPTGRAAQADGGSHRLSGQDHPPPLGPGDRQQRGNGAE